MKPLQTGAAEHPGHIFGVVWNTAVTIDVFNFSISILHEFSGEWCNFPVLKTFHCDCEGARGKESTSRKRIGGSWLWRSWL